MKGRGGPVKPNDAAGSGATSASAARSSRSTTTAAAGSQLSGGAAAAVLLRLLATQALLTAGLPAARGQPTCIGSDKDFDCAWRKLAVDFTVARLGVRRQLHALLTKFLPAA